MTSRKRTIEFEFLVRDREAGQSLGNIERDVGKLSDQFGNLAKRAGQALTAAGVAGLGGLAFRANQAAIDLGESTNAIEKVFGDAADTIKEFGETSSSSAGLATAEFQQLAAETGAMLKNLGLDAQSAADATVALGQRAADMASVFNTDVSEALQAINAGLRGEADPLERFGVSLKAANVTAQALAMGLADTAKELTDTDKALAAIELIMAQTNDIAGDFNDTIDDQANATRALTAEWTNFLATLGSGSAAQGGNAVNFVRGMLVELEAMIDGLDGSVDAAADLQRGLRDLRTQGVDPMSNPLAAFITSLGDSWQSTLANTDALAQFAQSLELTDRELGTVNFTVDEYARLLGVSRGQAAAVKDAVDAATERLALQREETEQLNRLQQVFNDRMSGAAAAVREYQSALQRARRDGIEAAEAAQAELIKQLGLMVDGVGELSSAFEALGFKAGTSADAILRAKAALEQIANTPVKFTPRPE